MRKTLIAVLSLAGLTAVALTSCGDPESIVEPYAWETSYTFSAAEVDAAGGWLEIVELGNDESIDTTPAVYVWGNGPADVDEDGDGPGDPVTHWSRLEAGFYRLDLVNGRLFIDTDEGSRDFRVVIARVRDTLDD